MDGVVSVDQLAPLVQRLQSLDQNCLTDLLAGLDAMQEGDLTVEVLPQTEQLELSGDADLDALITVFNSMLTRAQRGLAGYNAVREELRGKLGDHSILADLDTKMRSIDEHCLVSLGNGLSAVVEGDLSVDAVPVTTSITSDAGSIGSLGETFNSMLGKAQGGLELYNQTRRSLDAIAGDLTESLGRMQTGLGHMAAGDLTSRLELELHSLEDGTARGVFAAMLRDAQGSAESYEQSRDALSRLILGIQESAATVSAASQQMSSTSDQTGRAIEEIATAIGGVAAGAERQVQMVSQAREAADRTSEEAEQARSAAASGVRAAEEAAEAMAGVSQSAQEIGEAIAELAKRSEQISGIVDTITGIASQTNLLALNAAIEAARAGDQGRGFAVVADEVRKLAEESKTAATKIAALIDEIQAETQRTVTIADGGAARTARGVETVQQAQAAFNEIGEQVGRVTSLVGDIVTATNGVAGLAEDASASTQQVSASTEETSASSEEVAASAQELAATAQELSDLTGRFTVAV